MNKFNAQRTTLDGITFDSKREAEYYAELKLREKLGEVGGVELQRPFPFLGPKGELGFTYRADFAFIDHTQDGRFRVVDVKGVITREFKLKQWLFKTYQGIDIEVVK